jgi:signal transduction histidine kinase
LTGHPPDIFWLSFYLLLPLAGLAQVRLMRYEPLQHEVIPTARLQWRDVLASVRALAPLMATLTASASIMFHAAMAAAGKRTLTISIVPISVCVGLLTLATVRQVVVALEHEQLRREQELTRAHEEALREANQRMEVFLSIVAHELKTPLTSLSGNLELLGWRLDGLSGGGSGVQGATHVVGTMRLLVARCEDSLRWLARLVNDLLDDSRIREGRLDLHLERCDLAIVVSQAVEEQQLLAPAREIRLVELAAQPVPVIADGDRVKQVVTNYLTNALKYSREDQPVDVMVQSEGEAVRISVRDRGVGVPIAEQEQIWTRFHRAPGIAVQSGSGRGMGIGLHISKTIVERHHGQVGVESAPGQGSTFWFTLPLARDDE